MTSPEQRFIPIEPKVARPVSVVFTQILMAIFLVPASAGLLFVCGSTLLKEPSSFLTLRALIFVVVSFGVLSILCIGFKGLWKRQRYGYWIGLLYLVTLNLRNVYTVVPNIYNFIVKGDPGSHIADLVLQAIVVTLVLILVLKFGFGKNEKLFFERRRVIVERKI